MNALELVKEFHQQASMRTRLQVLKRKGSSEKHNMTQPVDSSTPQPHSHSPQLFSPFSIDCHGNYTLLDQILCDGPLLQQPWYNDSLPYTCQVACNKAIDHKVQEQLTVAAMAKLLYATTTSANNNNNDEENNTCAHQDNHGTLADPPSASSGHISSSQVRQQATP